MFSGESAYALYCIDGHIREPFEHGSVIRSSYSIIRDRPPVECGPIIRRARDTGKESSDQLESTTLRLLEEFMETGLARRSTQQRLSVFRGLWRLNWKLRPDRG